MLTFRDLAKNAIFRFMYELANPHSGLKKGPWKKLSPKKYQHLEDGTKVTIGDVSTEVQLAEDNTMQEKMFLSFSNADGTQTTGLLGPFDSFSIKGLGSMYLNGSCEYFGWSSVYGIGHSSLRFNTNADRYFGPGAAVKFNEMKLTELQTVMLNVEKEKDVKHQETIPIVVNGRYYERHDRVLTEEQLAIIAFGRFDPNIIYTITHYYAKGEKLDVSAPRKAVEIVLKPNMVINIQNTGDA